MFFVPDGTDRCGFYECSKCGYRFLNWRIENVTTCPECESEIDMEIGPNDDFDELGENAHLLEIIEGAEEVEKMDTLLSLAITGGDCDWI